MSVDDARTREATERETSAIFNFQRDFYSLSVFFSWDLSSLYFCFPSCAEPSRRTLRVYLTLQHRITVLLVRLQATAMGKHVAY